MTFLPDAVFICFEEFWTKGWLLSYTKTLKSDVAGGREKGRVVRSPRATGSKALKWIIRERNWLSDLNKFWIIEPNKRKFNKMWLFLKFIISVGSGHCDYSSMAAAATDTVSLSTPRFSTVTAGKTSNFIGRLKQHEFVWLTFCR